MALGPEMCSNFTVGAGACRAGGSSIPVGECDLVEVGFEPHFDVA